MFDESQVFRIDHYLGKETVQNILAFRFANGMFEPIWNRRYIDHVQITVAEDIGIEGRGAFYEQTGHIRDMISTHLFQMMTFLAMEPPVSFEPDRLRDETVKVLALDQRVPPRSSGARPVPRLPLRGWALPTTRTVETFSAVEIEIDNWRWAGVPVLPAERARSSRPSASEITLKFRKVPFNVFKGTDMDLPKRDHLTIRIQPNEGITLALNAKKPGPGMELGRVTMDFDYASEFADEDRRRLRAAPTRGDARATTRCSSGRTASSARGRSSSRCSSTHRRLPSTSPEAGVRPRPTLSSHPRKWHVAEDDNPH